MISESSSDDCSDDDRRKLRDKIKDGCGCTRCCFSKFDEDQVYSHVLNVQEMDKETKESYIMGVLKKLGHDNKTTRYGNRKRFRFEYTFDGNSVCRVAFGVLYDIGQKTLKNLKHHLQTNGPVPRIHGNKNRKPKHALDFHTVEKCVQFIVSYSEENGIPQPAAPRGRDDIAPIYLPASDTKKNIHKLYISGCEASNARFVKYSSFLSIWKSCVGHIKISTPEDDVCQKCEVIRKKIMDARTENDKVLASAEYIEHVNAAKEEREVYQKSILDAKNEIKDIQLPETPCLPLSSQLTKTHYTFDFAQCVAVPHHSRQMGPIYFLSPRKIQIFGFRIDAVPLQYNYLIDENQSIGTDGKRTHGPDAVIAMLDHGLDNYGYGEQECAFHVIIVQVSLITSVL